MSSPIYSGYVSVGRCLVFDFGCATIAVGYSVQAYSVLSFKLAFLACNVLYSQREEHSF
jgi:hypothetical protein